MEENMKQKILVIDDDPDILQAVQFMLEDAGYAVVASTQGEFLKKLDGTNQPKLILLDVLLSGLDGRDLAKRLKQQGTTRDIPIIMISAHPSAEKTALAAGADAFLAKPFDIDTMLRLVDKYYTNAVN
jgi:CheY-like chemotaxis protein